MREDFDKLMGGMATALTSIKSEVLVAMSPATAAIG